MAQLEPRYFIRLPLITTDKKLVTLQTHIAARFNGGRQRAIITPVRYQIHHGKYPLHQLGTNKHQFTEEKTQSMLKKLLPAI